MKCLIFSILVLILTGCPRKQPEIERPAPTLQTSGQVSVKEQTISKDPKVSKELRESLYFAASLEREALRLITKNNSLEASTLFSILSYAFETQAGTKKMVPAHLDCSRFKIVPFNERLQVFKICTQPEKLMAEVIQSADGKSLSVQFKIKEWGSIIGLPVSLTNTDIQCQLQIKEKKLNTLACENWSYLLSADHLSSTEIRLKTFTFDRAQAKQLHLVGGFFKDLVENKKIEVIVPLEGKIKLIEKELEVRDDFAEQLATEPKPQTEQKQIEEPHGNKESNKENEKENKTESEAENKKSEDVSQDQNQTEGQNQIQQQDIEQDQNNGGVPKRGGRGGR